MKLRGLYERFQIMPQLETHMLRVAGVGKLIAQSWKSKCEIEYVTQLCLVHDLGNIVKFDLRDNIDRSKFGKIENLKHWQEVQARCWEIYGREAHRATTQMLEEAGLGQFIAPINEEEKLFFAEARERELAKADVGSVILMYSDCRVTPGGVSTYRERVEDLAARYGTKSESWLAWTYWFEEWMQKQVTIDLNSINEQAVEPLFDELLETELE